MPAQEQWRAGITEGAEFFLVFFLDRIYGIFWIIYLFPPARNASQREAGGDESHET